MERTIIRNDIYLNLLYTHASSMNINKYYTQICILLFIPPLLILYLQNKKIRDRDRAREGRGMVVPIFLSIDHLSIWDLSVYLSTSENEVSLKRDGNWT